MKDFEYIAPKSFADAFDALDGDGAAPLGGGTDLLARMKEHVTEPDRLVDLRGVGEFPKLALEADGLTLGGTTKLIEVAENDDLAKAFPAIHQCASEIATPQIRHMATVAGNLLQRPRCWYYRNGYGLLGLKDGESLVRLGDNRYHAIFMTDGDALFVSPSNLAIPLIALGAKAHLKTADGDREVLVEELYKVPKGPDDRELTVGPDELLSHVSVPKPGGPNATYSIRHKQSHDWPLVLASVACVMDGDKVKSARIVINGVAPIPWRSKSAEDALVGKPINMETAEAAGAAAARGAAPLSMNAYKVPLTITVVKRALMAAVGNRYWEPKG